MVDPCGREALGGRGGEDSGRERRQNLGAWRGSRRWREGGGAGAVAVSEEEAHGIWARPPLVCDVKRAVMGREFA